MLEGEDMGLKMNNKSIRTKTVIATVIFSVVPVLVVTIVAFYITSGTVKEQLILNRRMSTSWLQERLTLEVKNTSSQLYEYEVDKTIRSDIVTWCLSNELDYKARSRLIVSMNSAISIDSNINAIEIYNLNNDTVLVANRSGAKLEDTKDKLKDWYIRNGELQKNITYFKRDDEILAVHQINRFEDGRALALVVIYQRKYKLQDILANIKMTDQESVFVFNDQNQLIEADYGEGSIYSIETMDFILEQLESSKTPEMLYKDDFWFYRSVGGKLKILMAVPNGVIISVSEKTIYSGIIVAIIAAFSSILCSALFSNLITKPIIKLSDKMRNFTLGKETVSWNRRRQDEIGVLEQSFVLMSERNKELIKQQFQTKLEKRNAQLRALQAQINPHFLYNTLQVIGGMAIRKGVKEINVVTIALSDILRYSLNFSKEMVCVRDEIQYLKSYLTIQNERFDNRIHLEIDVSLDLEDCLVPKLILQPMLENSFKHGLPEKTGDWYIKVIGRLKTADDIEFICEDNGIGIPKERLKEINAMLSQEAEEALGVGSHIGLCNVDARIRLRYTGEQYGVRIESLEEEGTKVIVTLKAIKEGMNLGI
jgi:two-component system sensor histidine kinase YesM